jgi:hypothetical protein
MLQLIVLHRSRSTRPIWQSIVRKLASEFDKVGLHTNAPWFFPQCLVLKVIIGCNELLLQLFDCRIWLHQTNITKRDAVDDYGILNCLALGVTFSFCTCTSVAIEWNSKLQRIKESAFIKSDLTTIKVLASIDIVCNSCFSYCRSLIFVTIEWNSRLHRIKEFIFEENG